LLRALLFAYRNRLFLRSPEKLCSELLIAHALPLLALGGEDADNITGHAGSDRLFGNADDDLIDAANAETAGSSDVVDCGSGVDTVIANDNDTVSSNCEVVTRLPNPTTTAAAVADDAGDDDEQQQAREEFLAGRATE
jgi:Ca2+-binding RTX toxin-like protein